MRITTLALLALSRIALGQFAETTSTGTASGSATTADGSSVSTSTASGASSAASSATRTNSEPLTQTISVGGTGHTFNPAVVQLSPGNVVEFAFYPTNHSVIRAEYKFPCIPYEMTGIDKIGFNSGFRVTEAILPQPDTFRVLINDSDPIFFYCGAPGSCIDWQMVGVINPNASVSLEVQKQFAANSSFMLLPGEPFPDEAETPFTTSAGTTSSTPTGSSGASTSSATPPATESQGHGLSSGAIAGIAIGGAAVAIAGAAFLFWCGRKSRKNKAAAAAAPNMSSAPPAYGAPPNMGYPSPMHPDAMTPTMAKHMSAISAAPVPLTDAFGNPTGQYAQPGYAAGFAPQQGYPMTSPVPPQQGWPQSPANDIFGQAPPPPQQHNQQPDFSQHSAAGAELSSQRASSPGSAYAPAPQSGGIQGFLQRQSRMSPPPQNEAHAQQSVPLMSHQRNPSESGPYEMPTSVGR